jgi:VCBS repeat-containing protein
MAAKTNTDVNTAFEEGGTVIGNVVLNDTGITNPIVTSVKVGNTIYAVSATVPTTIIGHYGTLVIYSNGYYEYTVDNTNPQVQALAAEQPLGEQSFQYILNGSSTLKNNLNITIRGTNDVPTISSAVSSGEVTEDGTTTATGTISFADQDLIDTHTVSVIPSGTDYLGNFLPTITNAATGDGTGTVSWDFTVDNTDLQFLAAGQTLTQTYTVTVADNHGGIVSQVVTVTINGTNDVPMIGGVSVGAVTEDDSTPDLTTGGLLTIDDVDQGQSNFAPQASTAGTYGTFTLAADGNWTYTALNSQTAIQQLGAGEFITDSFTAVSSDSSNSQVVTVTINGTNDAPTVSSVSVTGSSISFVAHDVDNASLHLNSAFADAFGNPTITPEAITTLTPTAQSSAISDTLQVTDGLVSANVIDLYLGTNGVDSISYSASASPKAIYGFDGNDSLTGGTGSDVIVGGAGADTIDVGNDTSIDHVVYNDITDFAASETISNFHTGEDKIDFSGLLKGLLDDGATTGEIDWGLSGGNNNSNTSVNLNNIEALYLQGNARRCQCC